MDAELLELQRQLEAAQSARSSVRLSERNVVELVQKLQERGIIDFDLLHTTSGKEYITSDHLKHEIKMEIKKQGRASLVDLSDTLGVDLYHVERQSQKVVSDDPTLMLINGEIMSQSYWDTVTEEINEKLQERSQIALAEIAAQLHIGSELVINHGSLAFVFPNLMLRVKGRLEGGQLYTPAYVSRITAMVRGATRGITVPTNLPSVWNSLQQQLQEMHGASGVSVEGSFFQSIFNGLLKEGAVLGSIRAGGHWTPAVRSAIVYLNSYIGYDVLQKLAIPQPKQYLEARYPDGIALDAVFVHPSVVDMLDTAVGDAIENGHWIDSLSVLPSYINGPDATKILSICPSLQKAIKSSKAVIFGESCVFSNVFIKGIFDRLEKDMDSFGIRHSVSQGRPVNVNLGSEHKTGSGQYSDTKDLGDNDTSSTGVSSDRGSKKKRGKGTGSTKGGSLEKDDDNEENIPVKGKKAHRKNKDAGSSGDIKHGGRKAPEKTKEESTNIFPDELIEQKVLAVAPELEELGGSDDSNAPLKLLSSHLRPMLVESWMKKRNTMLSGNAERRRRLLDNLQKQIDEAVLDMQLYEKALDVFEDDPATSGILHKHLLRSMGTPIVDKVLITLDKDNKLKNGMEVEDSEDGHVQLSTADRTYLAKDLPGALSLKSQALIEALEGKRFDSFVDALRDILEESGLTFKKLDKRLERTMLHSYRKDLTAQVSSENDPVSFLPKVVALLFLQAYNKALQAPGRAVGAVITLLKDKLPSSTYKVLADYHSTTVKLLALQAAATDDEEDCTSDRMREKKEDLEERLMPELKSLVLGTGKE
ncbi:E3 UFM1-protein ligase 1-like protein [Dichanthelium oligosanthes]|uniref:E3 UFM1-protein ligase 1-like protein n=1 Tax=Dichanthelium oligosanthes TaxID=888268 RepID=A0A1E5V7A2_9POAL|nr:E3 UFM1-protein ligase 1-like protein [Dichanthelium oligosanthes]